ncbi:ensconsin isoform X6 [Entelurus aequoreus]|uniref:ensconsin isoform X6 n=1 Tax=Entelurus aequoreus TaxID=161455 RepID=UPI002B1E0282|nr:ensconsin isoform X6 [Entelurus aequoreus]
MADGTTTLKGLRAQMAAAAQAQGEERRSQAASPAPPAKPQGCRPVIDGAALRVDDRLRVAKERREEAERQQALRESQIMERERKAKMQVERQLEERQKKAVEQRKKEEQKRMAVEEKRKQKQEEEKEHYEAVMRRTLERSQRVEQRQKRWSWGGLSTDSDGRGDSDTGASSPVAIVICPATPEKPPSTQKVDKRSTSTINLKQPSEANISKRLSSSSATLIKSPDKSASMKKRSASLTRVSVGRVQTPAKAAKGTADDQARKPPTSAVDGGVISRLLTPTQASLARSKSAAALSPEGTDTPEYHLCPRSASAAPLHPPRGPMRSRSIDRQKNGMTTSVSADGALDPSLAKQERPFTSPGRQRPPSPSIPLGRNRSPSPAPNPSLKRTPSPAAAKQNARARPPSPAMKQRPPSPQPTTAKPPPIQKPALTPPGPPTLRKRDSRPKDLGPVTTGSPQSSDSSKSKDKDDAKTGTNSAAEAAKILAENRRLMREQKEKEEQLRIQREEEDKLRKEEEERLAEEARLKREEEEKILAAERRVKEEEEALIAEEERVRMEAEDALKQAELQKEREEAEAKALVEAEKVRQERERVMQQNQQERMERKKRIEEIMKRTRKSEGEQNDFKGDDEDDDDDEGLDQMGFDSKSDEGEMGDISMETHDCGDGVGIRQPPVGCVNGREETDNKENNNEDTQAVSPTSKGRLVEGSEFLNEQDSAKVELVGSKSNQWSFEELMDLNVHSKTHTLIEAEDCNPVLINCDVPDGTKGSPVSSLHSSSPAIEALSEI